MKIGKPSIVFDRMRRVMQRDAVGDRAKPRADLGDERTGTQAKPRAAQLPPQIARREVGNDQAVDRATRPRRSSSATMACIAARSPTDMALFDSACASSNARANRESMLMFG